MERIVVPAGHARAVTLAAGQTLRIVNLQGRQSSGQVRDIALEL